MAARIYLVDDDRNILTTLEMLLKSEGYDVRAASNPFVAENEITTDPPDLAIFDVKMPQLDGFRLLRQLRLRLPHLAVIYLTSRDDEEAELEGFSLGADDYIKKPFSQPLLLQRVRAVLRRRGMKDGDAEQPEQKWTRGRLSMDDARHAAHWDGAGLQLTVSEYVALAALAQRPGHVLTRAQILNAVYGEDGIADERAVDSLIKRLRKKMKDADPAFDHITTSYGLGYAFTEGEG